MKGEYVINPKFRASVVFPQMLAIRLGLRGAVNFVWTTETICRVTHSTVKMDPYAMPIPILE
jgi:hypothetical protein